MDAGYADILAQALSAGFPLLESSLVLHILIVYCIKPQVKLESRHSQNTWFFHSTVENFHFYNFLIISLYSPLTST
jgi:hypothetical protein